MGANPQRRLGSYFGCGGEENCGFDGAGDTDTPIDKLSGVSDKRKILEAYDAFLTSSSSSSVDDSGKK